MALYFCGQLFISRIFKLRIRRVFRKNFGEFGRPATEFGLLFDQHDFVAGVGRGLGRGHSGDATADDHDVFAGFFYMRLGRFACAQLGAAHANHILGQHLRIFIVGFVAPGHLFAHIGAVDEDLLAELEHFRENAERAGRQTYAVEPFALDIGPDHVHARLGAQGIAGLGHHGLGFGRDFYQLVNIDRLRNVTAFTDIASNFRFHDATSFSRCLQL